MSKYATPIENMNEMEAMTELKAIHSKGGDLDQEDTERAVSLVRLLRRTTAGPAAAKASRSKKAEYASKSLDDLLG